MNNKDGVTVNWRGRGGMRKSANADNAASESELITAAWKHARLIGGWTFDGGM